MTPLYNRLLAELHEEARFLTNPKAQELHELLLEILERHRARVGPAFESIVEDVGLDFQAFSSRLKERLLHDDALINDPLDQVKLAGLLLKPSTTMFWPHVSALLIDLRESN